MDNHVIYPLVAENMAMADVERLVNIYWALSSVLVAQVEGDVAEVGCNAGKTSVFLRMVMEYFDPDRELHVYDSFQGLPAPGPYDNYLREGECRARPHDVLDTFARWGLVPPIIHEGWFDETLPEELPDKIAFAYIDVDFYGPTKTTLEHVYPRLTKGAIAVFDDYCDREKNPQAWDSLPGPKRACDEFFVDKPERVSVLVGINDLAFGYVRRGWTPPAGGRDPSARIRVDAATAALASTAGTPAAAPAP